ncbi:hypothetical protein STCU_01513 [Strigomonas culicis]|uniref:Uncharacterized protein n=1 Tax=Strigomonas culicis TaxID=28005 RepID=S9V0Q4_9TRYP|nr:hypothetical protein STCU_01513 [Strigomonas culicis]|eukprot:EPY34583.1 hypothetical protein STCU_01513 [Strigomonas culicis]
MPVDTKKGNKPGDKDKNAPPKKELPKELCGCGVDTYRPPPKGKKPTAPVVHEPNCGYQRTTCDAYPFLPRCPVCQDPCKFCDGKNRWCPHCYERQCGFRYKRLVHGWQADPSNVGPATSEQLAAHAVAGSVKSTGAAAKLKKRSTAVSFPAEGAPQAEKK